MLNILLKIFTFFPLRLLIGKYPNMAKIINHPN